MSHKTLRDKRKRRLSILKKMLQMLGGKSIIFQVLNVFWK
jgi:hypothetical protein